LAEATATAERDGFEATEATPGGWGSCGRRGFNAEDAEFGHEDTEELSWVLTAYLRKLNRAWVGASERGPARGLGELRSG
jgi:hypothetical protein